MTTSGLRGAALAALAAVVLFAAAGMARADAYDDLVTYDFTQPRTCAAFIEQQIRDVAAPDALKAVEAKLLKAMNDPKATFECKQFVCRMLRQCGTAASVPSLAKLLGDEKLSHFARYALQGMAGDEAAAALRDALGRTSGDLKIGVIASLGERGDTKAVPAIAALLAGRDVKFQEAAIRALGRIADAASAQALAAARVAPELTKLWADSYLRCADRMLAQGNAAGAETIYQKMYAATNPKFVRIAALRGQAMAQKEKAVGMLASLLADADADLAGAAARFLMELPGPAATASIAATVAGAPAGVQVRLIDILVERGDKAASAPVMALVAAEDAAVRTAAIRALGVLGDASAVPALAKAVSAGGDDAKAATNSLNQLKGEGVGEAMATLLSSPDAAIRTGILGVMTARGDKSMAPAMVKAARDADPGIRSAGISGLAAVGGQEQLADIADLLVSTKDEADRGNVERALVASVARCDDADAAATPLAAAMSKADDDAKSRLLTALAQAGGAKALAAVRGQLKATSEPVATQAVRSLAAWPDSAPADDLLAVMKTSANRTHKALAFRGYVRMANMAGVRPAAETTKMIQQALALATTSAEKKAVLAGLAGARSAEALKMVESLLADAELKAEAEAALLQVAGNCRDVAPAEARAALEKIVATTQNDALKGQAQGVLNDMNKYAGFISTWMGAGPYTEGNLFDTAYPPEKGDKTVKWKVLDKGVGPQIIDLLQAVSGGDNRAAYVRTYLYSPEARDAQFQMGSDDGIRAWVNGQQVHSNNATRPCKPGEDKAKAPLKQGWNEVLVKVTQGGADWSFSFRVCKSDGQPMTDVKVALEPQ